MTLDRYRHLADRALAPFVRASVGLGLSPDAVSVLAFLVAVAAAATFAVGGPWYLAGAALVFANGWLDLLDGRLARELDVASPSGDLVDHVLDRYADVAIVAGLAAGIGRWGLGFAAITGVLLTSYLGTQAEAVGLERVYGGLLGRADRLALVGVVAVVAAAVGGPVAGLPLVGWLLVLFAIVGHVTAVQRFSSAIRQLS